MTTSFLVFSLLFPRLTLLWCYLTSGIPINSTPVAVDVVGSIFVPRFLIAFWTYEAHTHIAWTLLFVLFGLAELGGSRASTQRER